MKADAEPGPYKASRRGLSIPAAPRCGTNAVMPEGKGRENGGKPMSESPTEHFEHAEHAEHVAHSGDPFLARVSIAIAILAVISAAVGSLESLETAATINEKTVAAIKQNEATDVWGQFSRESIKKTMYDIAAQTGAPDANKAKAKDYETRTETTKLKAEALQEEVSAHTERSEVHEHRHLVLTISATLVHIAIAIATIAIVMRGRRWPFHTAVILGILGTIGGILAFM